MRDRLRVCFNLCLSMSYPRRCDVIINYWCTCRLILNMLTVLAGQENTMLDNKVPLCRDDSSFLMSICTSMLHKACFSLLIVFVFTLQKQSVSRDVSEHLKQEYRAKG